MIRNNKGFSLITTLILSAVALSFIGALAFFIHSGSKAGSSIDFYKSSLEIAKGASELLMKAVDESNFNCDTSTIDTTNDFLENYKDDSPNFLINVVKYECKEFYAGTSSGELYLFVVSVNRKNRDEKAEVDFGYMKRYY